MTIETRFCELRQAGRKLSGVAMKYGDIGRTPFGREQFAPGAFAPIGDVLLNSMHDRKTPLARTGGGGLRLLDDAEALRIEADLPKTRAADDVLELVRGNVLRGLSIEFHALQERQEGDLRIVHRAKLTAVGVVDAGAYPAATVEARRRRKGGVPNPFLKAVWRARKAGACDCQGPECDSVLFEPGAWTETVASDREVLAVAGDYSKAVASRKRGTLVLSETDDGDLEIALTKEAGRTPAGRDLAEMHEAVPITPRPIIDNDLSEFSDKGGTRTFTKAHLRAVLLKPTERPEGWAAAEISDEPPIRRRRVYL